MKTFLLNLFLIIWLPAKLSGNVIYPQANISEFMFDSTGNWILELSFYAHPDSMHIDSIFIETHEGISKIAHYTAFQPAERSSYLAVITNDSLVNPVEVDKNSDVINVITYCNDFSYDYILRFGPVKYSGISRIPKNHSIAYVRDYCSECVMWDYGKSFSLDKTPTIGEFNTSDGTDANVSGHVVDIDNNPVSGKQVVGFPECIQTDENGYYYGKVISKKYRFDTNWVCDLSEKYIYRPDSLSAIPDSSYVLDLVLLSISPRTSIPETPQMDLMITNYPNPFTSETTFYISIPESIAFSTVSLEFFDNTGRLIISKSFTEPRSMVRLSAAELNLKPGIYYSYLRINGEVFGRAQSVIKL